MPTSYGSIGDDGDDNLGGGSSSSSSSSAASCYDDDDERSPTPVTSHTSAAAAGGGFNVSPGGGRPRSLSVQRKAELFDEQAEAADRIGELLAMAAESEEAGDLDAAEATRAADELLRKSLHLGPATTRGGGLDTPPLEMDAGEGAAIRRSISAQAAAAAGGQRGGVVRRHSSSGAPILYGSWEEDDLKPRSVLCKVATMLCVAVGGLAGVWALFALTKRVVGPPNQPVGDYRLVELQEGNQFFDYYDFYAGPDSAGSNGYITYVSKDRAKELGIARVETEPVPDDQLPGGTPIGDDDDDDVDDTAADVEGAADESDDGGSETTSDARRRRRQLGGTGNVTSTRTSSTTSERLGTSTKEEQQARQHWSDTGNETFVYLSTAPTEKGPRESVRLEGKRRFNRGLFIMDLRHMPAGCGAWPAFWLTDEANWPVNGEIDIVEGVSYQSVAKTALHSTKGCNMDDVPNGVKSGSWDTAVGIPDKKTGVPDMTFRYAQNCYVYDPHQWLNQGCVAVDLEGDTLGVPLNAKGGGVYALDWDPINRHIRAWVFTPHRRVPPNLMDAIRTAGEAAAEDRIAPDPNTWGLPYGFFPIGDTTSCPSGHFRNMRLVINLAFCGSVAGNRYFMDCPKQFKEHKTCNEYIKSNPKELEEAYWKIRGVYVYERAWERKWV